jgi:hemolysin III
MNAEARRRRASAFGLSPCSIGGGILLRDRQMNSSVSVKPRLRGVSHQYAFFLSLVAGAALVASASGGREVVASAVFAGTLTTMFGTSAAYHRMTWPPSVRRWMRRLDHAAIYLLIAGTYTPVGLLVLSGAWQVSVLAVVWAGCLLAIVLKLVWVDAPKWVAALLAVTFGWVGVFALPKLAVAGLAAVVLLSIGGLLYTAGALVYALGKPDPAPTIFGYHELFHALVIAAAACQYAAVASFVLPTP